MSREHESHDRYWHDDRELGALFIGHAHRLVHARSHIEEEVFRGRGSETLFTLTEREGQRTYIHSRVYLEPWQHEDIRVADAQAWYYPADRTLVLWELILAPQFERHADPRENLTLRQLWLRYEQFLADRFTGAEVILTTWEDTYDRDHWAGFLTAMGYRQTGPAVFRKERRSSPLTGDAPPR